MVVGGFERPNPRHAVVEHPCADTEFREHANRSANAYAQADERYARTVVWRSASGRADLPVPSCCRHCDGFAPDRHSIVRFAILLARVTPVLTTVRRLRGSPQYRVSHRDGAPVSSAFASPPAFTVRAVVADLVTSDPLDDRRRCKTR